MLNVDSRLGEHGLVRLLLVKMGEDVTILEGGECLSVAPDTNSTKSAWSNTWLAESNRLNELSTVVMMFFFKRPQLLSLLRKKKALAAMQPAGELQVTVLYR